jgi:hypothetical protein
MPAFHSISVIAFSAATDSDRARMLPFDLHPEGQSR